MAQSQKPIIIGSTTSIDFPKAGIKKVPAKVDTGADSSSIWASNIREYKSKLSFTLFGLGSPYYTGEVISTKDFHIRSVKNSFGHAESRYQVRLQAVIEGRTVNMQFNLANRSENTYPILIGRRTLHGRFMVDVSRNPKKHFKVLVIKPKQLKEKGSVAEFYKNVEKDNKVVKFTFATYDDLIFTLGRSGMKVRIGEKGKDVSSFDLVQFFIVGDYKDTASAVAQYLKLKGVPFVDKAAANYYQSLNKLHQAIVLQTVGVKVPKTIFISKKNLSNSYAYLTKHLGKDFVLKDIRGKKGKNNFLITSKTDFNNALVADKDVDLIAQEYIPNDGDYRLLIFGRSIKMVIHRTSKKDSYLNNIAAGGRPALVEKDRLPAQVQRMAINSASILDVDISGVDMVQDKKSGLWYCLEVNESPQLVASSYTDEKQQLFAEYIDKKLNRLL